MIRVLSILVLIACDGGPEVDAGSDGMDAGGDAATDAGAPEPVLGPCARYGERALPALDVVASSARAALQTELDARGAIVLDEGDYASGGPAVLRIEGDRAVIGVPGRTRVPPIVIAAGARGALVRGVIASEIRFEAGAAIAGVCVQSVRGRVSMEGASVVDSELVDLYQAPLRIDTTAGGVVRGNRFVRLQSHGANPYAIEIRGDSARRSGGNTFLWINALTPDVDAFYVEEHSDIAFIAVDAEGYNWGSHTGASAMLRTGPMGTLYAMNLEGGNPSLAPEFRRGMLDVAADAVLLHGLSNYTPGPPSITLRSSNARAVIVHATTSGGTTIADEASGALRLVAMSDGLSEVTLNGVPVDGPLPADRAEEVRSLLAPRTGMPWPRPRLGPIADPAPSFRVDRVGRPDEAPAIQAALEANGVVRLEPRAYYLATPLRMRAGYMLIGAGQDRTVLIAVQDDIDLVVSDELGVGVGQEGRRTISFALLDLTLAGGRDAIRLAQRNVQLSELVLSHVTFRDLTGAGVNVEGCYGLDNAFFDHVTFFRCGAGLRQRAPESVGDADDISYIDKTVFWRSRFEECDRGLDLYAVRQNNLNACIECAFIGNRVRAIEAMRDVNATYAACDFIDNAGAPTVLATYPSYFVDSRFEGGAGPYLSHGAIVEGCELTGGGSILDPTLRIDSRDSPRFDLTNSRSSIPLGALETTSFHGWLSHNLFEADNPFAALLAVQRYDTRGTIELTDDQRTILTLVEGDAIPGTRFLLTTP